MSLLTEEIAYLREDVKDLQHRLALKNLEIMRLRENLEAAVPYVIKDMERAIHNNFGRVDNDDWACRCVDAIDLVEQIISTTATYDDLMAWHEAQLGEPVAWKVPDHVVKNKYFAFANIDDARACALRIGRHITPLYAKKG